MGMANWVSLLFRANMTQKKTQGLHVSSSDRIMQMPWLDDGPVVQKKLHQWHPTIEYGCLQWVVFIVSEDRVRIHLIIKWVHINTFQDISCFDCSTKSKNEKENKKRMRKRFSGKINTS